MHNRIDLSDKDLFGNDAGEDEAPEVLNSYFVNRIEFDDFLSRDVKLSFISAKKGMGKSALLSKLDFDLRNSGDIVIRITGNSLLGLADIQSYDHFWLENFWKKVISKKITIELGSQIGLAFSDNSITIVEISEYEGMKSKNFVRSLTDRLISKLTPLPGIELSPKRQMHENYEKLIKEYQEKHNESKIWLLVDDIDAKFVNTKENKNIVASFFTAVRNITNEVQNLNIRATIRTDVWNSISNIEDLDKVEQYVTELSWTKNQLKMVLGKRILSYLIRKYPTENFRQFNEERDFENIIRTVFKDGCYWNNRCVSMFVPLYVFSNHRPRWLSQISRMSGVQAKFNRKEKIDIECIMQIAQTFGKNRIADLSKEHSHQFSHIDKLLDSFRSSYSEYRYGSLMKRINSGYSMKIGLNNIPEIDGVKYKSPEQIGKFLYKIGFISRKAEDGIEFHHFQDKPDLFESSDNKSNNLVWAVHPCYRNYLEITNGEAE